VKIRQVGEEFFHAVVWTDGQTDIMKVIVDFFVQFCERALKKCVQYGREIR